jgi:hypothetical protein
MPSRLRSNFISYCSSSTCNSPSDESRRLVTMWKCGSNFTMCRPTRKIFLIDRRLFQDPLAGDPFWIVVLIGMIFQKNAETQTV